MKNDVYIHIVEFEDKDSWIKGSSKFPRMFEEAFNWMEEVEGGYEEELLEFIDVEFIYYNVKNEEELMENIEKKGGFNIFVCGSHFISYAALSKFEDKENIEFLQFDYHPDLRDVYEGRKLSHATMSKRIAEMGVKITQIGIGEQSIEDVYNARKHRVAQFNYLPKFNGLDLKDKIYLSLDADAFSFFRNVSTPSLSKIGLEVMEFFESLFKEKEVVAIDLVELLGDKGDVMRAAQLIRKLLFLKFKIRGIR